MTSNNADIIKRIGVLKQAGFNERLVLHCQNGKVTTIDQEPIPYAEREFIENKNVDYDPDIEICRMLNEQLWGWIYLDFCNGGIKDIRVKRREKVG